MVVPGKSGRSGLLNIFTNGALPDRYEVKMAFHQYANGHKISSMWVRGIEIKSTELKGLIKSAVDRAGTAIVARIAEIWNDSLIGEVASNFASVVVIGGDSMYFMSHIKSRIPSAQRAESPEYANAAGYARLAHRALERLGDA